MFEIDPKMILEKGLLPLISTFVGAFLAFFSQTRRDKKAQEQQRRDFIISAYRTNLVNLITLLTFKNNFLLDFLSDDFKNLKKFYGEFVNPMLPEEKVAYQQEWLNKYHNIYLKLAKGKDSEPCLLRQRWEKPIFLPIQEKDLGFVARHTPSLLNIIAWLKSSEEMLHTELSHREKAANDIGVFFEDQRAIFEGRADFIKKFFMLLTALEGVTNIIDCSIALSVGLMAVLESYYVVQYGKVDFSIVKLSQRNIDLFPKISDYNNFFGSEENAYLIDLRLKYAQNAINGHRELNFPTSILPDRL